MVSGAGFPFNQSIVSMICDGFWMIKYPLLHRFPSLSNDLWLSLSYGCFKLCWGWPLRWHRPLLWCSSLPRATDRATRRRTFTGRRGRGDGHDTLRYGKIMIKSWENHGKTMGRFRGRWESSIHMEVFFRWEKKTRRWHGGCPPAMLDYRRVLWRILGPDGWWKNRFDDTFFRVLRSNWRQLSQVNSSKSLVAGLEHVYFPIYWVANHPNWRSYFSEGWPNHQPDQVVG